MPTKIERTCSKCGLTFAGGPTAKYCPVCRPIMRRPKPAKYKIDARVKSLLKERYDSKVRGRTAEIAAELGWPVWAVKRTAVKLGLTRPWSKDRRAWTADEEEFLRTWQGLRGPKWIGKRLGRGPTSVILKMKRLGLNRRIRDGYSINNLGELMGVDSHTVDRWVKRGFLSVTCQGTRRQHDIRRVSRDVLLAFLKTYHEEYRLDKVDQAWFLDLVFGSQAAVSPTAPIEDLRAGFQIAEAKRENAPTPAQIAKQTAAIRDTWTDENGVLTGAAPICSSRR